MNGVFLLFGHGRVLNAYFAMRPNICLCFSHRRTNYRVSAEYVCEIYQFNAATTQYLNLKNIKLTDWFCAQAPYANCRLSHTSFLRSHASHPSNYFESLDGDGFFSQSNTSFGRQFQCIAYGQNT